MTTGISARPSCAFFTVAMRPGISTAKSSLPFLTDMAPVGCTITSTIASGAFSAFLTLGKLTNDGFTNGAATIKITTSTSMTSMYGTTLISAISRREERREERRPSIISLFDVEECFGILQRNFRSDWINVPRHWRNGYKLQQRE